MTPLRCISCDFPIPTVYAEPYRALCGVCAGTVAEQPASVALPIPPAQESVSEHTIANAEDMAEEWEEIEGHGEGGL